MGAAGVAAPGRTPMSGVAGGGCSLGHFGALAQIDFAAKDGIIFNREPGGAYIALDQATGAQFNAARGNNVAVNFSLDQNIARDEVSGDVRAGADGQTTLSQGYGSFDTPVDDQVFPALYFTANHDGFANSSRTIFGCHSVYSLPALFVFD